MKFFRNIQPFIIIFYTIIFYLIGVIVLAPTNIFLNVILFNIILVFSFRLHISGIGKVMNQAIVYSSLKKIKHELIIVFFITVVFLSLIYSLRSIPILSDNPELARVILINDFGIIYRLGAQILFFIPPLSLLLISKANKKQTRILALAILIVTSFLLLTMGFRSRLIDYVFISLISAIFVFQKNIQKNIEFYLKIIKYGFLGIVIGFSLIIYLTIIREGQASIQLAFQSIIYRVFLLNYDVNFERIFIYSENMGFQYGSTFITDILSVFSDNYKSMQVFVTQYFNRINSAFFVMTPTVWGEFYLNFGFFNVIFVLPIVLIYRVIFEYSVIFLSYFYKKGLLFAIIINLVYYIPRIVVTGGISNAFVIKGLSILISGGLIIAFLLLIKVIKKI